MQDLSQTFTAARRASYVGLIPLGGGESLHPEGQQRQVNLVQVFVEEHRDLEQRACPEPRHPHAAVALQAEESAQAVLAATRGSQLDQGVSLFTAGVPKAVCRARRNDEDVARTQRADAPPDAKGELAANALEPLPLAAVDVHGDEAAAAHDELPGHTRPRPLVKDDVLSRDGIGDRQERLARYRAALDTADTIEQLVAVAGRIYRQDRESGHVAVVSQLVAGSLARPELAKGVVERIEPWVDFCEQAIRKVVAGSPLEDALPVRDLAYGLVSFYLGANLLTHLDGAARTGALFARAEELAPALAALLSQRDA